MFNPPFKLRYVSLALLLGNAVAVQAAEEIHNFNLPAQELSATLDQLAQSGQTKLVYADKAVQGLQAAPVKGNYTVPQALQIALGKTDLGYEVVDNKVIAVKPEKKEAANSIGDSEPTVLETVNVTDKSKRDSNDPYNKEYNRSNSSMATKTDTPILETPMSIRVVPRAVMDDQQSTSMKEIVQNVSGVQWSAVEGNLYDNFVIRGFDANNSTARNGVREQSFAAETANIERVEVLKGPNAMLYGRTEPGGLINRVTKQPLFTPYYSVQQQFGSFNNYRTTIDATAPITSELAYRVNFAYQSTKSHRDYVGNERVFFAPSILWKPTAQTEVGLTFEYQHDYGRWDDGIPAVGNRPANVPINRYLGDPKSFYEIERELVDFHWSHEFNKDWKINQRFVASLASYHEFALFPWSLQLDNQTMDMGAWNSKADRNTYSQNINLVGHFDTWGAKHTFLGGFDFYIFEQPGVTLPQPAGYTGNYTQNLYNPSYGQFNNLDFQNVPSNSPNSWGFNGQNWYGIYLQDQIKVWDKLQFLLGGRYDWATIGTAWNVASNPSDAETIAHKRQISAQKFSPRFGILYQPVPWMSVYGSYSESLGANNGRNIDNSPLKPQEGRQYEVGMKGEFFDKQLTTSVAFFDLTKTNIQTPDPNPALAMLGYARAIGAARSRGIEFDLSGKVSENLNVIANYAWTNTRITKDYNQTNWDSSWTIPTFYPNGYVGNRLPLAPLHSANIWLKYEFTDETFKGLNLGLGTHLSSKTQGDPANDFQLAGYTTMNAMVSYKRKIQGSTITAQLNVNNLLDHRYYAGADQVDAAQRYNINPAAPINFMGSLRWEY